jgi:hypothetical protein
VEENNPGQPQLTSIDPDLADSGLFNAQKLQSDEAVDEDDEDSQSVGDLMFAQNGKKKDAQSWW